MIRATVSLPNALRSISNNHLYRWTRRSMQTGGRQADAGTGNDLPVDCRHVLPQHHARIGLTRVMHLTGVKGQGAACVACCNQCE
jgi:hypothetical protein